MQYRWKYKRSKTRSVVYFSSIYYTFTVPTKQSSSSWSPIIRGQNLLRDWNSFNFLPSPFSFFFRSSVLTLLYSFSYAYSMLLTELPFFYFCLMIFRWLYFTIIYFRIVIFNSSLFPCSNFFQSFLADIATGHKYKLHVVKWMKYLFFGISTFTIIITFNIFVTKMLSWMFWLFKMVWFG